MGYPVGQLYGKTFIAIKDVPFKRYPEDSEEPIGVFKAGAIVGVLDSHFNPKPPNRNNLYFGFKTNDNKFYYIENLRGQFDVQSLIDQGAMTDEQLIEAQRKADETILDQITNSGIIGGSVKTLVTAVSVGIVAFLGIKAFR